MSLRLRKYTEKDCKTIYLWRNHPVSLKWYFNKKPFSYKTHVKWFKNLLKNNEKLGFILENEKKIPLAQIRFEPYEVNSCLYKISIAANPLQWGKGYGTTILNLACQQNELIKKAVWILAEVKTDNKASYKVFIKNKFINLGKFKEKGEEFYKLIKFIPEKPIEIKPIDLNNYKLNNNFPPLNLLKKLGLKFNENFGLNIKFDIHSFNKQNDTIFYIITQTAKTIYKQRQAQKMTLAEQTKFWQGEFGNEYTERNQINTNARLPFFKKIASLVPGTITICELGANKGHNLLAFAKISKNYKLTGVELNQKAYEKLAKNKNINAICDSIQNFNPENKFDLVFTCGVLIHLPPDDLDEVYKKLFDLSNRYILINEYFNPQPVEIPYRNFSEKLFKRDFAKEFANTNKDKVKLIDYGFLWKYAEPAWDNTTWWLFEKNI